MSNTFLFLGNLGAGEILVVIIVIAIMFLFLYIVINSLVKLQNSKKRNTTESNLTGMTKRCPYCGEEIKREATKCKYCGELLEKTDIVNPGEKSQFSGQQMLSQSKPNSFLVWSILATIFCCLPFGIVAIIQSTKVDSLWAQGDYVGSMEAARKARTWFWCSLIVSFLCLICCIIVNIIGKLLK